MTQVDFYILGQDAPHADLDFICRLTEKAYRLGHRIYIHSANQADAEQLDEKLWTYDNSSFLPHNLAGEGPNSPPPIQIGHDREPQGYSDLLINMASPVPVFFSRFRRVAEIVPNIEARKAASREHYRFYRERGYPLRSHQIP